MDVKRTIKSISISVPSALAYTTEIGRRRFVRSLVNRGKPVLHPLRAPGTGLDALARLFGSCVDDARRSRDSNCLTIGGHGQQSPFQFNSNSCALKLCAGPKYADLLCSTTDQSCVQIIGDLHDGWWQPGACLETQ